MTVDQLLFRASANGDIMTDGDGIITPTQLKTIAEYEAKEKLTENQRNELIRLRHKRDNPELSTTCKKRLVKVYAKAFHDREEDITSKYLEKGIEVEEDSLTTYSRFRKKFFKKNEINLTNKFTSGTPDFFDGPTDDIMDAEEVIDIKSSWSLITFLNAKMDKKTNADYEWQGHTYLGLLKKARRFRLAYVLSNSPSKNILDEKRKLQFMLGVIDPEVDPEYIRLCQKIERNHIFDMALFQKHNPGFDFHNDLTEWKWDIPFDKRVHEIVIERSEEAIAKLYKKVPECREWIKNNLL